MLGLALDAQGKGRGEAIESLRRASSQFPNARLAAARILCREGAAAGAISELEAYLRTPDVPERRLAEDWLARLKAANLALRGEYGIRGVDHPTAQEAVAGEQA